MRNAKQQDGELDILGEIFVNAFDVRDENC
jgi:hypothetical protein